MGFRNTDHDLVEPKKKYVDPYPERSKEMLAMKDKKGKNLYRKKGNDIVPNDGGFVYPNLTK